MQLHHRRQIPTADNGKSRLTKPDTPSHPVEHERAQATEAPEGRPANRQIEGPTTGLSY